MEIKYQNLMQILIKQNKPVTSKKLAYNLDVSTKTIRNYVKEINNIYQDKIILSSGLGYSIDRPLFEKNANSFLKINLPTTQKERVNYIVKSLLQSKNNSIDLYEIGEEIAFSIESLKSDLVLVKEVFIDNDIYVTQKNEIIKIEGPEPNKRKLLGKLLSGEFSENILNLDVLESVFPDFDLRELVEYLNKLFFKYHYFVNDYALLNLILEICIEVDRVKRDFLQSDRHIYIESFSVEDMDMIKELACKLSESYQISYSENERKVLANMVLSYITKLDYTKLDSKKLKQSLDMQTNKLINILMNQMSNWELFDVTDESFLVKFSLHIKNLLDRIHGGGNLRNPISEYLKQNCPIIFEHAIEIANTISVFTHKEISEDEIGFLALHIGSIMGENTYLQDRIKTILLLPNYYDFSYELMKKIENEFGSELAINQVVSSVDNIDDSKSDLMINAGPFLYKTATKEIQITPFYTKNDSENLKQVIEQIKLSKKKSYLHKHLVDLTSEELFFKINSPMSKEEVIKFMCDCLIRTKAVGEDYYDEVIQRENQSPTAFGRVAVPHSIRMNAKTNKLVILLSDKGIKWDKNVTVHIVLLFAVKKDERSIFFNVFDSIVTTLVNPNAYQDIISSNNLEKLIQLFLGYVDEA